MIFKGCAINLVTPFTDTNEIDFECLERLVKVHLSNGVSAIVLGRSTGEFQAMNDDEIISVLESVVKTVKHKIPVIVQTGFNDMARSVGLSIRAKMSGADALILSSPYYNHTNKHGLLNHFRAMAIASSLPCYIENDPIRCGFDISTEIIELLTVVKNIVGVIESSEDINKFAKLRAVLPDDIELICGNDKMAIPALSLGASGYISVLANICPEISVAIYKNFMDGDISSAREVFFNYLSLMEALDLDPNPIPIKTTMNMLGYDVGEFRLPLSTMDPDKAAQIATLLMDMGIIDL
ncbi:MAG: 4-hydroxy-tetrahydrodipicolinate synthase [Peptostreptococcus sp.]|uniref:4-hydroxy-tetrahydrodipicolinate synthase n=1 Tax=Peptostreptococcus sp. TaxID=1262 RepID=UPI002FC889E4